MESIIIAKENDKKEILRNLSKNKLLYNVKFYDFKELKKKLYFDYDDKTLEYIMKKLKVKLDVAKVYLDNMYFLRDIDEEKIQFLNNLKKELEDNKLLIKDELFRNYIKDKKVILYNYENLALEEKIMLIDLGTKYEVKIKEQAYYQPVVYEACNMEEEVEFVLNEISKLINKGIDLNNIKIIINNDYNNIIKRYFQMYQIPINLQSNNSYYSTALAQEFLANYDLEDIKDNVNNLSAKYEEVNDLITIINKSVKVEDKKIRKEFIINDLKNNKIKDSFYDKAIEVKKIDDIFEAQDYVFLLGFNINVYPKVYRDDDYLSDEAKHKLGLDTSIEKNKLEKDKLVAKLRKIKNLTITYKLNDKTSSYYPSILIQELNLEKKEIAIDNKLSFSKNMALLKYAKLLDNLTKYNIYEDDLKLFKNSLDIPYKTYHNEFKGIDHSLMLKSLNNELVLAYTNLEKYNECAFKYYVSRILKIDIYEENFKTIIGNVAHHILELAINRDIDILKEIMEYVKQKEYQLKAREYFYLEKLSKELEMVIKVLKKQASHSKLNKYLFEEELYVYKDREINVTFKGLIDKVMYQEIDNKEVIVVVDYKTGKTMITLDNLEYGLNMQLPIYLYLLKKSERFKEAIIGGFYIQKILDEVPNKSDKSIEELREENLKLQGYSNSLESILELIDDEYRESKIIKDLKYKNDGTISAKAKVLSNLEMDNLTEAVEEKIEEGIKNILEGKFEINPKVIKNKNVACQYCKFKDICFKKRKDEVVVGGDNVEANQRTTISN